MLTDIVFAFSFIPTYRKVLFFVGQIVHNKNIQQLGISLKKDPLPWLVGGRSLICYNLL